MGALGVVEALLTLSQRLLARDPAAVAVAERLRLLAASGDQNAKRTLCRAGVEYFSRKYPPLFEKARSLYASRDPRVLARVVDAARRRDPTALALLAMLKSIRDCEQTAAAPGGPQIGYHALPSHHRIGVMFGQLPGGLQIPLIPGLPPLPNVPGLPGYGQVIYQIPGFPPITPDVITTLTQIFQRAMSAGPPMMMSAPPAGGGPGLVVPTTMMRASAAPASSSLRSQALMTVSQAQRLGLLR